VLAIRFALPENDLQVGQLPGGATMTLGRAQRQLDMLDENRRFCERLVGEKSVYALLQRERDQLFPDEMFEDLFAERGRRSIPPCVVAVVMVLQKAEGLSDREAVERLSFDLRWKYAAGVEGFQEGFVHTVLVNMRARLRDSADPHRIFRVSKQVAEEAGLIGLRRVLDSTPLYDAVATQDTVTLIRSASGACCGSPTTPLRPRSASTCAGTTTTPGPASRPVTGTIPRHGRR
jgi:hypothetical protein